MVASKMRKLQEPYFHDPCISAPVLDDKLLLRLELLLLLALIFVLYLNQFQHYVVKKTSVI